MSKVAVVTGANKGLGFAIVKGLLKKFDGVVYLTSRNVSRGQAAVTKLNKLGLKPEYHQLDVSDRDSIIRFRDYITEKHGGVDILVNNAAIAFTLSIRNSHEVCKHILDNNYFSILCIQELLYPLMRSNGRILNISSDCGHLCNIKNDYWIKRLSRKDLTVNDINDFVYWFLEGVKNKTFKYDDIADKGTIAAYRISKVALSAVTMVQQKDLAWKNISVNSLHPGHVQTDMTFGNGFFDIDQAADTPLYLMLEAPQSLKGAYVWYDRRIVDWYDYKGDYYLRITDLVSSKFLVFFIYLPIVYNYCFEFTFTNKKRIVLQICISLLLFSIIFFILFKIF